MVGIEHYTISFPYFIRSILECVGIYNEIGQVIPLVGYSQLKPISPNTLCVFFFDYIKFVASQIITSFSTWLETNDFTWKYHIGYGPICIRLLYHLIINGIVTLGDLSVLVFCGRISGLGPESVWLLSVEHFRLH